MSDKKVDLDAELADGQRAYDAAMKRLGQTDPSTQPRFAANLRRRQKALAEMLAARQQPLAKLANLEAFSHMPGFKKSGTA